MQLILLFIKHSVKLKLGPNFTYCEFRGPRTSFSTGNHPTAIIGKKNIIGIYILFPFINSFTFLLTSIIMEEFLLVYFLNAVKKPPSLIGIPNIAKEAQQPI